MKNKVEYVDIPSEEMIDKIRAELVKQFKDIKVPGIEKLTVGKLEWTKDGLRVWFNDGTK